MKIRYGKIVGMITVLVLSAVFAYADGPSGVNEPGMSGSSNQQMYQHSSSNRNDPQTVMHVQRALSDRGYYKGTVDGKWSDKTESAVQEFQKSQGMQASGKLDHKTLALLGIQSGTAGGVAE